ncbi:MAG: amino acid ABC transporter substrate-binding protein, partial [Nocardioides sp.]
MRLRRTAFAVLPLLVVAATACAPEEEPDSAADPTPTSDTSESPTDGTSETPADTCAVDTLPLLKPGTLTIGTDSPAYDPWFAKNDPTNGKGFESAVAYAVADELGFTEDQVTWVKVPFNLSFAP